jgi:hypothetical protein
VEGFPLGYPATLNRDTLWASLFIEEMPMQENLDRLVEIARILGFAIAVDPFADTEKPTLTASLYGSVHAALDMAHGFAWPDGGATELEQIAWDEAVRNGYLAALREIPAESDAVRAAFLHKMLLMQVHRLFDLTSAMDSVPAFAASAALSAVSLILRWQLNAITGDTDSQLQGQIIDMLGQMHRSLREMFPVQG